MIFTVMIKPFPPKPGKTGLLALLIASSTMAWGQFDDFNDGNPDAWTEFSPLTVVGAPAKFSFPNEAEGDQSYRIESPAPQVPAAGPARGFAFRKESYSDFVAGVDIVGWNNDVNQAFGFTFRAGNIGLGQTEGYVLNYNAQHGSGGRGQIQFNIVTGEADQGTIGAANLSFEPGRRYRILMEAKGDIFTAWVYDLNDLTSPLTTYWGTNDLYASGVLGLFNYYRGGNATDPVEGIADTTFDNFFAAAEDNRIPAPGAFRGIEGWPHILSLEPLNRTAYHPAEKGIEFRVSTLGASPVTGGQVRLILNGRDISAQSTMTPEGSDLMVRSATLEPNTVYDARIEVTEANGTVALTEWTFDTFSEEFLASDEVKIIEAEDYNFDRGKFLEDPSPSGFRPSGSSVNADKGYLDREGEPEVDFFDYDTSAGPEELAIYRSFDPVATQAGDSETGSAEQFSGPDPVVNDTIRAQYSALELPEFQVTNIEGGEWLNYTRTFAEGDYQVYLRAAARASVSIELSRVTSDPAKLDQTTKPLGHFHVPNMGMEVNYRFVPLLNASGQKATLSLSGKQTLRLTIGTERENRINQTTVLNYLAFVPARVQPAPEPPTVEAPTLPTIPGLPPIVLPPIPGQQPGAISGISLATDGTITIEFTGRLQSSDTIDGTYADVSGATSPFTIDPSGDAKFYIAR